MKISFGKNILENKNTKRKLSAFDEDEPKHQNEEKIYISHIEGNKIVTENDPEKTLVIPLQQKSSTIEKKTITSSKKYEITEKKYNSSKYGLQVMKKDKTKTKIEESLSRPLLLKNDPSNTTESSSLSKESDLKDYEQIPIELFGEAMLRGMGWDGDKEQEEESKNSVIKRPKTLGLGSEHLEIPKLKKSKSS